MIFRGHSPALVCCQSAKTCPKIIHHFDRADQFDLQETQRLGSVIARVRGLIVTATGLQTGISAGQPLEEKAGC